MMLIEPRHINTKTRRIRGTVKKPYASCYEVEFQEGYWIDNAIILDDELWFLGIPRTKFWHDCLFDRSFHTYPFGVSFCPNCGEKFIGVSNA